MHGQQAYLGRPEAGHHEPEQLLQLDQELAVNTGPGRPRLLRCRRLFDRDREPFGGVVVVVGLTGRPSRVVLRAFAVTTFAVAHLQDDWIADLAAVNQHGRGQHPFAHVVPAHDAAAVQVFGYDGRHDDGGCCERCG